MTASRYEARALEAYLSELFLSRGVPADDSRRVAGALISTSLRGVDTHGIRLAPKYLALLDAGNCRALPKLVLESRAPSLAVLDADRALGQVAGLKAVDAALEMARTNGVGLVLVRNSSHFGAAACYTLPIAAAGMIGFATTNSDALVAPFSGKSAFLGTNPIAIAAPGEGDEVLSLDMATSQSSYSRLCLHRDSGEPLGPGWALDPDGRETLDPSLAAVMAPLGGYKGMGLALAVQILTSVLAGGSFDHELANILTVTRDGRQDVHHLVGALDIARFIGPGVFRGRLSALLRLLRASPPAGEEPVRAPGDLEGIATADRNANGIPVSPELVASLRRLAPSVPFPRPRGSAH